MASSLGRPASVRAFTSTRLGKAAKAAAMTIGLMASAVLSVDPLARSIRPRPLPGALKAASMVNFAALKACFSRSGRLFEPNTLATRGRSSGSRSLPAGRTHASLLATRAW